VVQDFLHQLPALLHLQATVLLACGMNLAAAWPYLPETNSNQQHPCKRNMLPELPEPTRSDQPEIMHGLAHVASLLSISLNISSVPAATFMDCCLTSSAFVVLRAVGESNAPHCSRMTWSGSRSGVGSGGLLRAMMTLTCAGLVSQMPACQVQDCHEMHGGHGVPLSLSLPHHTQRSSDPSAQNPHGKMGSCLLWDHCAPSFSGAASGGVPPDRHHQSQTNCGEHEKSMGPPKCSSS